MLSANIRLLEKQYKNLWKTEKNMPREVHGMSAEEVDKYFKENEKKFRGLIKQS